jgi:hypothetical protein
MSDTSFLDDFRSATSSDAFKAAVLPSGIWEFEIIKADTAELKFERKTMSGDVLPIGHKYVSITLKPVKPISVDDDDLDATPEWTGCLVNVDIMDKASRAQLWTPLLEHTGLDLASYFSSTGFDLDQALKDLLKKHVAGTMKQALLPAKDDREERLVSNFKKFGPLDD